eukprot:TRINITY_DN3454_c0_g1_i1.p1 TRINITY_DN3454_c0_g1~~TRINITY_DN3454_c0_g1_i1.p1  ORF type:complete len:442 (+),score=105.87 TRINITY_DN3454_c0_g1_i1:50-1375(+)
MAESIEHVAKNARLAALKLAAYTTAQKNDALTRVHSLLSLKRASIEEANEQDLSAAKKAVEEGRLSASLLRRLDLHGPKYDALLAGLLDVAKLDDPVGQVTLATELDQGLQLYRVTCPIGVVCVIFEARPEAAIQIASLCLKSANAVILKGGKEAEKSNDALISTFREALQQIPDFPVDAVQLVNTREEIKTLLALDEYIDLVIPRGSNALVKFIQNSTRIPVMGHADGICSVYVDESANLEKAVAIVVDSKTQYPSVCNAAETLLVHHAAAPTLLPQIAAALFEKGVELRVDAEAAKYISGPKVVAATEEDYHTEFLELIMAVKIVSSVGEAVAHVNSHGSHHTDSIVTENKETAEFYMSNVDSANVYFNASTRFADGFRYGFGAEVGVSTHKTHARGPVGLDGMVIYKYRMYGEGHCVANYGEGKRKYTHAPIENTLPK